MQKIRLCHLFVLEIWFIKKSCNLIGWKHFGPYLRKYKFSLKIKFGKNWWQNFPIIEKTLFWCILDPFSQFWGQKKKFFQENLALSRTTSHGILAPCQNLEKIYDTIPRKCTDRNKDGRTDRPYFIGSFPLPLGSNKQGLCHYSYHYWIHLNMPK